MYPSLCSEISYMILHHTVQDAKDMVVTVNYLKLEAGFIRGPDT